MQETRPLLCGSISGERKNIVSLFSAVSWLQMRWQCSLHAQLLSVFFFFFSRDHDKSALHRETSRLHHSHYSHSLLLCAWQHNYQSRGPVQLIAGDCWQRGLEWRERSRDETGSRQRCSETGTVPVFQVLPSGTKCHDDPDVHGNTTNFFSLACVERRCRGWWWWWRGLQGILEKSVCCMCSLKVLVYLSGIWGV